MDCGPCCLRMIAQFHGKYFNSETLRRKAGFNKHGVSLLGISETAENIGFRARGIQVTFEILQNMPLPCILHWQQNHFVVLISINKKKDNSYVIKIADPAIGIMNYSKDEFLAHWISSKTEDNKQSGTALLLEPTPAFHHNQGEKNRKLNWQFVLRYVTQSKWKIAKVFAALIITSLIQLIFPFLTQSIVDKGINDRNLHYVVLVLIAQLMLTFSKAIVEFIRSRQLLSISNILNFQILSDFWIKVTKLPLSYFDVHRTGDTLQRIGDHKQIQNFLTTTAFDTFFSVFNFIIYAIVLMIYNIKLFFVFLGGSILYFTWIQFFLKIKRKINYETFYLASKENNATLQLIQGMQEIRLNNAQQQKRGDWESIQSSIFKLNFKNLNYNQWQQVGATLINQSQDIVISFIVAKLVIDGQLTLGAMLAVQYIIGQLSGPVNQWVSFVQSAQDAQISMERLNEIHELDDEEDPAKVYTTNLPNDKSILIKNLSFTYPGAGNDPVLTDIHLYIPSGKVTAIVGISGSGKTTLLKLLLKIYEQYEGEITIGVEENSAKFPDRGITSGIWGIHPNIELGFADISPSYWRQMCGAVMQEGFIFNDTIEKNIAVGAESILQTKLRSSCKTANILSFIESLPNGFQTEIGTEGVSLSQGQKQRILIARAIYKDPDYLFFDEATNSLDANNEKEIIEGLFAIFKGKTVIVVAHRLSTVRNADKIVVLHQATIVEEGTHEELVFIKGKYYELVKNQLELGM